MSHGVAYEKRDISFGSVAWFLFWLAVVIGIVHIASGFMIHVFRPTHEKPGVSPPLQARVQRLPPEPRLQVNPAEDLRQLRAQEQALLDSYGWVDREQGVVHIPIERAEQLLLERGLPARKAETK